MMFSWDEAKRTETIARRGVDFVIAAGIFDGVVVESVDERRNYRERRVRALGEYRGVHYVVVYTQRGAVRHIIAAWRLDEAGRRRYARLLAGGTP